MVELPVILLGAGGHARVVADLLHALDCELLGCVAPEAPPETRARLAWLGDDDVLERHGPERIVLANGIGSTRSTGLRRELFERFAARGFRFPALVHPGAIVAHDVELGAGAQVMAGAVVQTGTRIEADVIVNSGAVVDHDCRLGAHSHVAPGAVLSGGVTLGEDVHVGTGAQIIQCVTVGAGALIAAGATVTGNVPPAVAVGGTPARILDKPARARVSGA